MQFFSGPKELNVKKFLAEFYTRIWVMKQTFILLGVMKVR